MTLTVLLADDHPLVRKGVRGLLEMEGGFSIVGEAEDGLQVVQLAERFQPDILLVDLMMPNMNGLEVIKQVSRRSPKTRMIVLSMQSAAPYVLEAFRSGATGYVLKDSAPDELIDAIQLSLQGVKYLSPKLPSRLINEFAGPAEAVEDNSYNSLTERERQVFQMVAEGRTAAEIAALLSISPRTVELHRSKIMAKIGVHNRAELVRYAMKRGILLSEA